eukprot:10484857-Lingulodinium_polyedra.AAC.1
MQWVGQRKMLADFIVSVSGVTVKNVGTHSSFTNKAEDNAWAFVETDDEVQGNELIMILPRSNF